MYSLLILSVCSSKLVLATGLFFSRLYHSYFIDNLCFETLTISDRKIGVQFLSNRALHITSLLQHTSIAQTAGWGYTLQTTPLQYLGAERGWGGGWGGGDISPGWCLLLIEIETSLKCPII